METGLRKTKFFLQVARTRKAISRTVAEATLHKTKPEVWEGVGGLHFHTVPQKLMGIMSNTDTSSREERQNLIILVGFLMILFTKKLSCCKNIYSTSSCLFPHTCSFFVAEAFALGLSAPSLLSSFLCNLR